MNQYKYTMTFSLLSLPLMVFVIALAGGGYGSYWPFLVLFPFSMTGSFFNESISTYLFVAGLLQFFVYGFLLDKMNPRKVLPFVFIIHVLCVFTVFMLKKDDLF
ncbi:hypothetical protein ACVVIH_23735 [Chryseobacterium arthrosphaerae]|uniref:hypothetical protein n=1 Tax=Chryseobacterium arthrosphaerae TaxID=651561 RepID=UPI003D359863